MDQKGLRGGHFIALVGALASVGSLWRPWYTLSVPPQVRDLLSSGPTGRDPGLLGQISRGLAASLPSSLSASGWVELEGADVAVCVAAIAVAALVLGAAGAFGSAVRVDARAAARLMAGLGAVGGAIALVHVLHRPFDARVIHVGDGLWIALAGSAATLIGGLMAATELHHGSTRGGAAAIPPASAFGRLDAELPPVFAPAPGATAGSVPPPGA